MIRRLTKNNEIKNFSKYFKYTRFYFSDTMKDKETAEEKFYFDKEESKFCNFRKTG